MSHLGQAHGERRRRRACVPQAVSHNSEPRVRQRSGSFRAHLTRRHGEPHATATSVPAAVPPTVATKPTVDKVPPSSRCRCPQRAAATAREAKADAMGERVTKNVNSQCVVGGHASGLHAHTGTANEAILPCACPPREFAEITANGASRPRGARACRARCCPGRQPQVLPSSHRCQPRGRPSTSITIQHGLLESRGARQTTTFIPSPSPSTVAASLHPLSVPPVSRQTTPH